jgi:hypothetical protein
MKTLLKRAGVAAGAVIIMIESVVALTAVKPLEGYVCMGLKSDKEFNDWVPGSMGPKPGGPEDPPVFQAPTEGSRLLGYNSSPVIVKWPVNEVGGFVEMLRLGGEKGWIKGDLLVPYGTVVRKDGTVIKKDKKCIPSLMSNGRIGFDIRAGK